MPSVPFLRSDADPVLLFRLARFDRKQRAIEEPFAKDLLLEREALAKAVTALHDEQEALQGEFQTLKQVSNELVDKIVRNVVRCRLTRT